MDKKKSTVVGIVGGALIGFALGYDIIAERNKPCVPYEGIPWCETGICPICQAPLVCQTDPAGGNGCPVCICQTGHYACNEQIVGMIYPFILAAPFAIAGSVVGGLIGYFLGK